MAGTGFGEGVTAELPFVCKGGRCPVQTCAAAREAAAGGFARILAGIFPPFVADAGRSLVTCLNVFNIPAFFSGLGVLPRCLSTTTGGVKLVGTGSALRLIVRGESLLLLFLVVKAGRCEGRR